MTTATPTRGPTAVQSLEAQKTRVTALQERRTRIQVRLETEAIALATANAEAIEAFGTAELDALVQRFKDDSANNDSLVAEFTQGLDLVEQQLADIERQIKL